MSSALLKQLGTMFDPETTKVVQLTKSYRSTKQITDFTKHILIGGEAIEAFEREGNKPHVYQAKNEQEGVATVINILGKYQKDHDAVAIIGKDLKDSEELYQKLNANNIKATLIRTENQRLVKGPIVVPSYLAKGLEFDAVIVWNANDQQYHGNDERQLLYTICSRAMHELSLVSIGRTTSLLNQVPTDEYEKVNVDK